MMNQNNATVEMSSLSLEDLEIQDVDVDAMTREEAIGIPELGASYGQSGCCSNGCM